MLLTSELRPVEGDTLEKEHVRHPETRTQTEVSKTEVDVGHVAKKALVSLVLTVTNSVLTLTVAATKLTGFLIIPSVVLGRLTQPLHAVNKALSKHAFTPFSAWTHALKEENTRIIATDKVIGISNKKLVFYPERYIKHAHDSFKATVAPIPSALLIAGAATWIVAKPLYMIWVGFAVDACIVQPILFLGKSLGYLTYSPLKNLAEKMYDAQEKFVEKAAEGFAPSCADDMRRERERTERLKERCIGISGEKP